MEKMNRNPHEIKTGRITKATREVKRFLHPETEAQRDNDYVQVFRVTPENARDRPRKQNRLQWLDEKLTKTQTDFTTWMDTLNEEQQRLGNIIEATTQQHINSEKATIQTTFSYYDNNARGLRALCLVKIHNHKDHLQTEKQYEIDLQRLHNIKEDLKNYTEALRTTFNKLDENSQSNSQLQKDDSKTDFQKRFSEHCFSKLKELANGVAQHVQDANQRLACINQFDAAREKYTRAIAVLTSLPAAIEEDRSLDSICSSHLDDITGPSHLEEEEQKPYYKKFTQWVVQNMPQGEEHRQSRRDRVTHVADFLDKMARPYNLRQFLSKSNINLANLSNEEIEELITKLTLYNHEQYKSGVPQLGKLVTAYITKQPFNDGLILPEQNNG